MIVPMDGCGLRPLRGGGNIVSAGVGGYVGRWPLLPIQHSAGTHLEVRSALEYQAAHYPAEWADSRRRGYAHGVTVFFVSPRKTVASQSGFWCRSSSSNLHAATAPRGYASHGTGARPPHVSVLGFLSNQCWRELHRGIKWLARGAGYNVASIRLVCLAHRMARGSWLDKSAGSQY